MADWASCWVLRVGTRYGASTSCELDVVVGGQATQLGFVSNQLPPDPTPTTPHSSQSTQEHQQPSQNIPPSCTRNKKTMQCDEST